MIAIGLGVDADHLTADLAGVVVLALGLPAALWWAYFSGDDAAAEHALAAAEPGRRAILAIRAYFYAHIPMLLGIVVVAAGIHEVIAHPAESMSLGGALALGGGTAMFFLGDVEFRRVLRIGAVATRFVVALAALATLPIGLLAPGWIQLAAVITVVAGMLTAEGAQGP